MSSTIKSVNKKTKILLPNRQLVKNIKGLFFASFTTEENLNPFMIPLKMLVKAPISSQKSPFFEK